MRASLAVLSLAVPGVLLGASCTKLTPINLAAVEPCGQENQALNGVKSFRVLSTGADVNNVAAFRSTDPGGFEIGLGERVIVTIEGFADDITLGDDPTRPTVLPKAIGRTVPMTITDTSAAVRGTVLVGKVDSFGSPRDIEGNCSFMDNGGDAAGAVPGRHGHTATYVPAVNKVLIYGGAVWVDDNDGGGQKVESFLRTAELYDPTTGFFTPLPEITPSRAYHTATALPDGRVAIWGGFSTIGGATTVVGSVQIVDVRTPDSPYSANPIPVEARVHHTATLLADVKMLVVVGGCSGGPAAGCTPSSASAESTNIAPMVEVLNLADLSRTTDGDNLGTARAMHQAVAFPSGGTGVIAIIGGLNGSGALDSVEILQVDGGSITTVATSNGALPEPLVRHQASIFDPQGLKFITSGGQTQAPLGALSDDAAGTNQVVVCSLTDATVACTGGPPLQTPRYGHAMARLRDGSSVVIGGITPPGSATAEALRRNPGTGEFTFVATAGALPVARERAAIALLGGESDLDGFINQVFYSGGHTTSATGDKVTSNATDIFFGP